MCQDLLLWSPNTQTVSVKADNNGNILDSAYSSRSSSYIRCGHAISSQSGQMWRCAANLYINTHLSGHGIITWPGEADNLRQVKHVNSFFLAPVCHAAAATSVSGKIIKKFTLTNGWSRNSSRTYWVSSRVTTQSPEPGLLLQHRLSFCLPVMLYWLCVLANISLLSHLSSSSPPLFLSPAVSIYLPIPLGVFSPSLQSMWLLRCLSICSPRQAQCAGATLWLLGQ